MDFLKSLSCKAILELLQLPEGSTGPVSVQATLFENILMEIHWWWFRKCSGVPLIQPDGCGASPAVLGTAWHKFPFRLSCSVAHPSGVPCSWGRFSRWTMRFLSWCLCCPAPLHPSQPRSGWLSQMLVLWGCSSGLSSGHHGKSKINVLRLHTDILHWGSDS